MLNTRRVPLPGLGNNCNTAADQNVAVRLAGNARGPVATSSTTFPTSTPTSSATGGTMTPTPTATATAGSSTANALPFEVTAGPFDDADEPFASITICAQGTSNCTTVNDVLIDTGSFGLRIFGSQIQGLGIAPNTNGNSEIGECAFFGSGSTWGAISTVDVKIGGFYCPSGTLSESATNKGVSGSVSGVVSFSVVNADTLFNSNDAAFDDLSGTFDGGNSYDGFDWGLPFFFGRNVYVGLDGKSSSLGSGPYTAY